MAPRQAAPDTSGATSASKIRARSISPEAACDLNADLRQQRRLHAARRALLAALGLEVSAGSWEVLPPYGQQAHLVPSRSSKNGYCRKSQAAFPRLGPQRSVSADSCKFSSRAGLRSRCQGRHPFRSNSAESTIALQRPAGGCRRCEACGFRKAVETQSCSKPVNSNRRYKRRCRQPVASRSRPIESLVAVFPNSPVRSAIGSLLPGNCTDVGVDVHAISMHEGVHNDEEPDTAAAAASGCTSNSQVLEVLNCSFFTDSGLSAHNRSQRTWQYPDLAHDAGTSRCSFASPSASVPSSAVGSTPASARTPQDRALNTNTLRSLQHALELKSSRAGFTADCPERAQKSETHTGHPSSPANAQRDLRGAGDGSTGLGLSCMALLLPSVEDSLAMDAADSTGGSCTARNPRHTVFTPVNADEHSSASPPHAADTKEARQGVHGQVDNEGMAEDVSEAPHVCSSFLLSQLPDLPRSCDHQKSSCRIDHSRSLMTGSRVKADGRVVAVTKETDTAMQDALPSMDMFPTHIVKVNAQVEQVGTKEPHATNGGSTGSNEDCSNMDSKSGNGQLTPGETEILPNSLSCSMDSISVSLAASGIRSLESVGLNLSPCARMLFGSPCPSPSDRHTSLDNRPSDGHAFGELSNSATSTQSKSTCNVVRRLPFDNASLLLDRHTPGVSAKEDRLGAAQARSDVVITSYAKELLDASMRSGKIAGSDGALLEEGRQVAGHTTKAIARQGSQIPLHSRDLDASKMSFCASEQAGTKCASSSRNMKQVASRRQQQRRRRGPFASGTGTAEDVPVTEDIVLLARAAMATTETECRPREQLSLQSHSNNPFKMNLLDAFTAAESEAVRPALHQFDAAVGNKCMESQFFCMSQNGEQIASQAEQRHSRYCTDSATSTAKPAVVVYESPGHRTAVERIYPVCGMNGINSSEGFGNSIHASSVPEMRGTHDAVARRSEDLPDISSATKTDNFEDISSSAGDTLSTLLSPEEQHSVKCLMHSPSSTATTPVVSEMPEFGNKAAGSVIAHSTHVTCDSVHHESGGDISASSCKPSCAPKMQRKRYSAAIEAVESPVAANDKSTDIGRKSSGSAAAVANMASDLLSQGETCSSKSCTEGISHTTAMIALSDMFGEGHVGGYDIEKQFAEVGPKEDEPVPDTIVMRQQHQMCLELDDEIVGGNHSGTLETDISALEAGFFFERIIEPGVDCTSSSSSTPHCILPLFLSGLNVPPQTPQSVSTPTPTQSASVVFDNECLYLGNVSDSEASRSLGCRTSVACDMQSPTCMLQIGDVQCFKAQDTMCEVDGIGSNSPTSSARGDRPEGANKQWILEQLVEAGALQKLSTDNSIQGGMLTRSGAQQRNGIPSENDGTNKIRSVPTRKSSLRDLSPCVEAAVEEEESGECHMSREKMCFSTMSSHLVHPGGLICEDSRLQKSDPISPAKNHAANLEFTAGEDTGGNSAHDLPTSTFHHAPVSSTCNKIPQSNRGLLPSASTHSVCTNGSADMRNGRSSSPYIRVCQKQPLPRQARPEGAQCYQIQSGGGSAAERAGRAVSPSSDHLLHQDMRRPLKSPRPASTDSSKCESLASPRRNGNGSWPGTPDWGQATNSFVFASASSLPPRPCSAGVVKGTSAPCADQSLLVSDSEKPFDVRGDYMSVADELQNAAGNFQNLSHVDGFGTCPSSACNSHVALRGHSPSRLAQSTEESLSEQHTQVSESSRDLHAQAMSSNPQQSELSKDLDLSSTLKPTHDGVAAEEAVGTCPGKVISMKESPSRHASEHGLASSCTCCSGGACLPAASLAPTDACSSYVKPKACMSHCDAINDVGKDGSSCATANGSVSLLPKGQTSPSVKAKPSVQALTGSPLSTQQISETGATPKIRELSPQSPKAVAKAKSPGVEKEEEKTPGIGSPSKASHPKKGKGKGAAPPPRKGGPGGKGKAAMPIKPDVVPSVPLKKLYWNPISLASAPSDAEHNSVWERIHQSGASFDECELEVLFAEAPPTLSKVGQQESQKPRANRRRLFDEQRRRQIWFMLALLPERNLLPNAIMKMDDAVLEPERVELLLSNLPTPAEEAMVNASMRDVVLTDNEVWDVPEEFTRMLIAIPEYALRIQVWGFLNAFQNTFLTLTAVLDDVHAACDVLQKSACIEKLLALILYVGNYLNGGTSRGRADGFDIDTLTKLGKLKASPKEFEGTLLDFIIKQMEKENAGMLADIFTSGGDFHIVHCARKHKLTENKEELAELIRQVEEYVRKVETSAGPDESLAYRKEQLQERSTKLHALKERFAKLDKRYADLCAWFRMDLDRLKPADEFFNLWNTFLVDVKKALDIYEKKQRASRTPTRRPSGWLDGRPPVRRPSQSPAKSVSPMHAGKLSPMVGTPRRFVNSLRQASPSPEPENTVTSSVTAPSGDALGSCAPAAAAPGSNSKGSSETNEFIGTEG